MIKVRRGTFETNSSSVHAIAIQKNNNFTSIDEFLYIPYVAVAFMYAITILSFTIVDYTLPFVYIGIYVFIMSFFKLVLYVEDKRNGK